ncbi:Putative lysophospholipase, catalytic domain, Acyl transferase/acyl hydrolase/lysophospholipase [Septoria linicola]|uniref:Lysophospholipase n=1 Tax=Septoria linicola TaxID=215465 RepID=A0A9Q9B304_9PEZI|nr:Putative lysophospholipase, catalytic domain, Acyl transferase/acyl hydrolase/lysophospholipase [Septoria linicola]
MRTSLPATLALSVGLASSNFLSFKRQQAVTNAYVPTTTSCPTSPLIRSAESLNSEEKDYVSQRSTKASQALSSWLSTALEGFSTEDVPALALALSGGGTKAGLTTAGAVYGLDGRESSDSPTAGLLQSMTYVSALSGGSLTLSGIMANDFAQVSTLRTDLLDQSYQNAFAAVLSNADAVRADVGNKTAAGFPATLIDVYGKVISYNFITASGGNELHWSAITSQSSFENHDAPFPIITITQTNVPAGMCEPNSDSAIWEVSPLEFGSWDDKVDAFYPTQYMGTTSNSTSGQCLTGYDNTGFITAISSNILNNASACDAGNGTTADLNELSTTVNTAFPGIALVNPYGIIRDQAQLFGTDGGDSGQAIPVFPWLQPEREVDVIFLIDAATQQPGNITNGTWLYNTYTSAQEKGLTKMPEVPTPADFIAQNLSARAQFYGCHDANVTTLIYLPNTEEGDAPTGFFNTPAELNGTFDGGVSMVTQSQSGAKPEEWAACVACAIVHKTAAELPEVCGGCLERYCWPRNGTDGGSGSGNGNGTEGAPTPSTGGSARVQISVFALAATLIALLL